VGFEREIDNGDPMRHRAVAPLREVRHDVRPGRLAGGTLACPECDAPVAIPGPVSPAALLACPYCDHAAPLRDFLSLAAPTRPARVEVRIAMRVRA
jgi:uncharacterized paraquat-inducible protein A